MSDHRAVLDADEFQFVIMDGTGEDLDGPAVDGNGLVSFAGAPDLMICVLTSEQWGPTDVTVAALSSAPPVDDSAEDVVELSVRSSGGLVVGELMGESPLALTDAGGEFRVRVSAWGRDAGAALSYEQLSARDDDAEPVERFRIEAWPAALTGPTVIKLTSAFATAVDDGPDGDEGVPAHVVEAMAALGRDLDGATGARPLSGALGEVHAEHEYPVPRRSLFSYFAILSGWIGCSGGDQGIGVGAFQGMGCYRPDDHPEDRFVGTRGEVSCVFVAVDSPKHVAMRWNWHLPPTPDVVVAMNERHRFLAQDSVLRIDLIPTAPGPTGTRGTRAVVTHDGLPVEWLADMATFWTWQLGRLEAIYELNHQSPA